MQNRVLLLTPLFSILLLSGCQGPPPDPMIQLRPIMDRYVEVWNGGDPALLDEIMDPQIVRKPVTGPLAVGASNLEELKQVIEDFRTAYPDVRVSIIDTFAQGDRSAVRWSATGTNTGPGQMPATGKSFEVEGVSIARYVNGKMVEELVYFDTMIMATQLGFTVTPPAAETAAETAAE